MYYINGIFNPLLSHCPLQGVCPLIRVSAQGGFTVVVFVYLTESIYTNSSLSAQHISPTYES